MKEPRKKKFALNEKSLDSLFVIGAGDEGYIWGDGGRGDLEIWRFGEPQGRG